MLPTESTRDHCSVSCERGAMSSSAHAPTWAPRHPVFRSRGLASTASPSHTASSVGGGRGQPLRPLRRWSGTPSAARLTMGLNTRLNTNLNTRTCHNSQRVRFQPVRPLEKDRCAAFSGPPRTMTAEIRGCADRADLGERVRASAVAGYFAGWLERSSLRVIWPCRHLPAATRPRCRCIRPELVTHRTGRPARRFTGYDKRCISEDGRDYHRSRD